MTRISSPSSLACAPVARRSTRPCSQAKPQRAYQVGDRIIILPSHHSWRGTWEIPGERVAGPYTSDAPVRWLSIDEMVAMLEEVPDG